MKVSDHNGGLNSSREEEPGASGAHSNETNPGRDEPVSKGNLGKSPKQDYKNNFGRRVIQHQPRGR